MDFAISFIGDTRYRETSTGDDEVPKYVLQLLSPEQPREESGKALSNWELTWALKDGYDLQNRLKGIFSWGKWDSGMVYVGKLELAAGSFGEWDSEEATFTSADLSMFLC